MTRLTGIAVSAIHLKNLGSEEKSKMYFHLGNISEAKWDVKSVREHYENALKADSTNGRALIALAKLSLKEENFTKAELLYTRAEVILEVKQQAILGKVQVFLDSADYVSALKQLRLAYSSYPNRSEFKDNIVILENVVKSNQETFL